MTEDNKPRATEERFDTLHHMVTEELIKRIKANPETADLKAAMDWLRHNGINSPGYKDSPLADLAALMPELTINSVQERVHGTKSLL